MAIDPEDVKAAQEALERVRTEWEDRHGVNSIEIARLWDGDSATDDVCIRITVDEVLAPEDIREGERFPRYLDDTRVQIRQGSPPSIEHF